jgi:glutamate-ammonia-ligase adenylyltransferase
MTPAGILYEVDIRLRPSGASGLMVSSMDALAEYQRQSAWIWEHQALVRARPVAGDRHLAERFNALRHEMLVRDRDPAGLRREVLEMRGRMREEHTSQDPAVFRLKHDPGGITDIEFMVQYGVLRWAAEYPALTRWTDDIRLLESLAQAGLMKGDDAQLLGEAYRAYRVEVHHLTLQGLAARVPEETFARYRDEVARLWRQWLETGG